MIELQTDTSHSLLLRHFHLANLDLEWPAALVFLVAVHGGAGVDLKILLAGHRIGGCFELFKEFYFPTHHSLSAQYLYFGLDGHASLKPFIWVSVAMVCLATGMLTLHPLRKRVTTRNIACILLFLGILLEKGLGTIIPGFIPEPWGRIDEYFPTWVELVVSLGIWSLGAFVFTILAKAAIPIELGTRRFRPDTV